MAKISGGFGLRKDGPESEDECGAKPEPLANIGERRPPSNGFEHAYLDCATGSLLRGLILEEDGFTRPSFRGVDMFVYLWVVEWDDDEVEWSVVKSAEY